MATTEKIGIPVGSGYIYETPFTGEIPDDATIETDGNRLGFISKGATLNYKPTFKQFTDDMGRLMRSKLTAEEATFKMGLISWAYSKLNKMISTARITEGSGKRTIKIGGLDNDDGVKHLLRFVHPDKELGDLRITIVGTNTGGLQLDYKPDDSTDASPEFTAMPSDDEGTLILIEETDPTDETLQPLVVNSVAGTTSGTTKITVAPTLAAGNSYKYYTAVSVVLPSLNATVSAYTAWDGSSDITATTGYEIAVVEVDSNGLVKKAGKATVTAKA